MTEDASKPAVVVDTKPETGEIKADINIGGANIKIGAVIKDKRFWIIIAIVVGAIVGTKEIGLW